MGDQILTIQWPNPLDYNEAVQFPEMSFEDTELQNGEVELNPLGLPKVASGNFASVYRLNCGGKSYAIKCFNQNVFDQHHRYAHLSQFTTTTHVQQMVGFEYQLKGIYINENWFPIVKMDWVDGLTLDMFVRKNWSNKAQIERITNQFVDLVMNLNKLGIAHCDLQHGNILVKNDSVKLVDYDNMFVPALKGQKSAELGHGNYQHPKRTEVDFHQNLDNFSAWIIYYSLFLLRLDSSLWQRFEGGDDCLLFRKSDFTQPDKSRLLVEISRHDVPDIRAKFQAINMLLRTPLSDIAKFNPQATTTSKAVSSGHSTQTTTNPIYPERWPSIEQYFWSVLRPRKAFSDKNLANAVPVPTEGKTTTQIEVDSTTIERLTLGKAVIKGRNHIVFHMVGQNFTKHYAVKLFRNNLKDRHTRYIALHKHPKKASGKYFVPFVYQKKGIYVGKDWFPVLKMQWIEGETIDQYVLRHLELGYADAVEELLPKFVSMITALNDDGIAHGDLEPSNLIIDTKGNLKIVDYDTMYIPALASLQSADIGVKAYQHPQRNLTNFGNYLDNFSSLTIYGVLSCLSRNPPRQLWNWDSLIKHVLSRTTKLKQQNRLGQKRTFSDGLKMPKQKATPTSETIFNPVFEKVTHEDIKATKTFDNSVEKLARVIQEQRKRRIDQVSKLNNSMWDLA